MKIKVVLSHSAPGSLNPYCSGQVHYKLIDTATRVSGAIPYSSAWSVDALHAPAQLQSGLLAQADGCEKFSALGDDSQWEESEGLPTSPHLADKIPQAPVILVMRCEAIDLIY